MASGREGCSSCRSGEECGEGSGDFGSACVSENAGGPNRGGPAAVLRTAGHERFQIIVGIGQRAVADGIPELGRRGVAMGVNEMGDHGVGNDDVAIGGKEQMSGTPREIGAALDHAVGFHMGEGFRRVHLHEVQSVHFGPLDGPPGLLLAVVIRADDGAERTFGAARDADRGPGTGEQSEELLKGQGVRLAALIGLVLGQPAYSAKTGLVVVQTLEVEAGGQVGIFPFAFFGVGFVSTGRGGITRLAAGLNPGLGEHRGVAMAGYGDGSAGGMATGLFRLLAVALLPELQEEPAKKRGHEKTRSQRG